MTQGDHHARCSPSSNRAWERENRGFSLVETLVAMVVLSLSLGVLYQATVGASRNLRVATEYAEATALAESLLEDRAYGAGTQLSEEGSFGAYRWVAFSFPSPVAVVESDTSSDHSASPAVQMLAVQVIWGEVDRTREVELVTAMPVRVP